MRMLLRVRLDTAKTNVAITDGTLERVLKRFVEEYNPEAAYFFADHGRRAASFVFDMRESSQIPALVEPMFKELGGEIELLPVMNYEDLQSGLATAFAA